MHLIRDGRDVAVSLAGVSWGTDDAAEAARTWAGLIRAGRLAAAELDPGRYMEVRYEELVVRAATRAQGDRGADRAAVE